MNCGKNQETNNKMFKHHIWLLRTNEIAYFTDFRYALNGISCVPNISSSQTIHNEAIEILFGNGWNTRKNIAIKVESIFCSFQPFYMKLILVSVISFHFRAHTRYDNQASSVPRHSLDEIYLLREKCTQQQQQWTKMGEKNVFWWFCTYRALEWSLFGPLVSNRDSANRGNEGEHPLYVKRRYICNWNDAIVEIDRTINRNDRFEA